MSDTMGDATGDATNSPDSSNPAATGRAPRPARRVVIADDEPLARERLRMLLAGRDDCAIVGEAEDGASAVEVVLREKPDLVFLDVRMPELSGVEVAEALQGAAEGGGAMPQVVFVTAYEEHAVRAIELEALDYLLKPVDRARLDRALERLERRRPANRPVPGAGAGAGAAATSDGSAAMPDAAAPALDPALVAFLESLRAERAYARRILVRDAKGALSFVRTEDVDWADAQGNYVRLHVGGAAHLVRDTMHAFEEKLDPERFVRIHRSAIVNLDRVQRFEPFSHGQYLLTMRDGTRLRTSRAYGARLLELLR